MKRFKEYIKEQELDNNQSQKNASQENNNLPGPVEKDIKSGQDRQSATAKIEKDGKEYIAKSYICHTPEGPRSCK